MAIPQLACTCSKGLITTAMSYVMVDIESDGPIPGDYSMICFGAVLVSPTIDKTSYGKIRTISQQWIPIALAVSGFKREEELRLEAPRQMIQDFRDWLNGKAPSR